MGPPPKVVPRPSSLSAAVTAGVISNAPQGKPLPRALAVVIMSGRTPYRSAANGWPLRPTPICTSSKMSCAPTASQRARSAARNSAPMSKAPPTPCTGSTITAATSSPTVPAIAEMSRRGTQLTSKGVRGNSYHFLSAPQVIAPAAAVRPWNPPSTATTRVRRVILNAMRSAFSLASAPEFTKKMLSKCPPAKRASLVAARTRTSIGTALLWKLQAAACADTARVQPG